jgi:phosphatidylinositol 4-kinase
LSSGEVIFLLTMHDLEGMRATAGLPSSLVPYFTNNSINSRTDLSACLDSMAEKVGGKYVLLKLVTTFVQTITDAIQDLNHQARTQSLPGELLGELQVLLISSTHRVAKARTVASKYLHRLITFFPSLMCDPPLVFSILEVLTLLRRSCEGEYVDEVRHRLLPHVFCSINATV